MENTTPHHSHTQLYIVVGLLVIFAILFFTFRAGNPPTTSVVPPEDTTPLHLKRIILSAEEAQIVDKSLYDPSLSQTKELTKAQAAAQAKAFSSEVKPAM